MKRVILLVISLVFIGCTQNSAFRGFDMQSAYSENIKFTKKIDFVKNEKINTMIYISYLNGFTKEYNDKEYFLVGIYNLDKNLYIGKNLDFSLNSKKDYKFYKFEIEKNIELFDGIKLKNPWAKYYIVSFEKMDNIYNLELKIENKDLSTSSILSFEK